MNRIINAHILRISREAKGWDQRTLAQMAGVNPSVISRLERELQTDLKASVLISLAQALEISLDTLVKTSVHFPESSSIPNLGALLAEVEKLPSIYQRQIAALLYGYLMTLPPHEYESKDTQE